jgi:alkanesulfonate monooxygenase SsuD/methylene tetrahydromethanopterin reductase-like flavin-dependent oxidoreductase (luciferase family)
MVHTFIGADLEAVKQQVREPFLEYLRTHVKLYENPAMGREMGVDMNAVTEADKETLISFAFERFFHTGALMGTPETCWKMVDQLAAIGVDEVACLIDFARDREAIMASLREVASLKDAWNRRAAAVERD